MDSSKLEEILSKTGKREASFRLMINHLRKCRYPFVVETGITGSDDSYERDGMSTIIFDLIINETEGTVQCVDIDPNACRYTKDRVSNRTMIYCGDSIRFLDSKEREYDKLTRKIDLLYLDTQDNDGDKQDDGALHCLYELLSIKGALKPGSLIAVDGNDIQDGKMSGNGVHIARWMDMVGKKMVFAGYQCIWEW
jgi:hypothetical protein